MESYGPMSVQFLDSSIPFDPVTTAELARMQSAYSYPPHMMGTNDGHPAYVKPETPHPYPGGYEEYPDMHSAAVSRTASPEAPSIERGNKLLSFQPSTTNTAALDYPMRHASISVSAQLHGMFFLAEQSRASLTGDLLTSPAELTCYRRNLFQISGSVTMPRMLQYAVTEEGERLPIVSQELTISATESVEGSPVKIISVPWKTPITGTPIPAPEEKVEKEPTSIVLDQQASHDMDSEYSVFPIAWKRLQFRVATANNGRRRELQQHFTIKLSVVATLSSGAKVALCDALSGPVIVRGRSPRNFQQRKDVPLSGSGVSMRKSISTMPTIRRSSTVDSVRRREPTDGYFSLSPSPQPPQSGFDWQANPAISNHGFPMTPQGSLPGTAPVSPYNGPMPDLTLSRSSSLKRKPEDGMGGMHLDIPAIDFSMRRSCPPERPYKVARRRTATISGPAASTYVPVSHLPSSSLPTPDYNIPPPFAHSMYPKSVGAETEMMGDYFPLGVEDWSHSGDGVYRPHFLQPRALPTLPSVGGPVDGHSAYMG